MLWKIINTKTLELKCQELPCKFIKYPVTAFRKNIYQRALQIEMPNYNLNFIREFEMPVFYRSTQIGTRRVDFLVEELISVELKAILKPEDVHPAQAINYLEAYTIEVGLLINFGSKSLEFKRLINTKYKQI